MRPKESRLPIAREQVHNYHHQITRTAEFLKAHQEVSYASRESLTDTPEGAQGRSVRPLARNIMARAALSLIDKVDTYENMKFDPAYNALLGTLPGLDEGIRGLQENSGAYRTNKENVIRFNHAVKSLINTHPATSPDDLTTMLRNTFHINGYSNTLIDHVQRDIIPGMEHELAFESNLFYLPDNPEILETSVDEELKGTDYIIRYQDGIVIRIDVKKSPHSAARKTLERAERRKERNIRMPDDRLIIASGYGDKDFVPGKIGRITESAREREQARISGIINTTHQRLASYWQRIDNLNKI